MGGNPTEPGGSADTPPSPEPTLPNGSAPREPSEANGTAAATTRATWLARLSAFYREYNPAKASRVEEMLDQFCGQEEELWVALQDKYVYCTPPPPGLSPQRETAQTTLTRPTAASSGKYSFKMKGHVILTVTKGTARGQVGLTCEGGLVTGVVKGSPASRAGVVVGMTVLTVDGEVVDGSVVDAMRRAPLTFTMCMRQAVDADGQHQGRAVSRASSFTFAAPRRTASLRSSSSRTASSGGRSRTPTSSHRTATPKTKEKKTTTTTDMKKAAARRTATPTTPAVVNHSSTSTAATTATATTNSTSSGGRRYNESRKPAVPRQEGTRPTTPQRTPRGTVVAVPWVSSAVPAAGGRNSPVGATATARFEQQLQQKGASRQRDSEQARQREFEEQRLRAVQERLLREEGEKARLLEAKMHQWEELVAKKEKVLQMRMGRPQG